MKIGTCALCDRDEVEVTRHHLIPRTRHKNKKAKKDTVPQDRKKTEPLCRPCHSQIHNILTEKEMERDFNTLDKLKAHPDVAEFIAWVSKKQFGKVKRAAVPV